MQSMVLYIMGKSRQELLLISVALSTHVHVVVLLLCLYIQLLILKAIQKGIQHVSIQKTLTRCNRLFLQTLLSFTQGLNDISGQRE